MITLDDEVKAREMVAQHGGYLVKANGKFYIMNAEKYVRYDLPVVMEKFYTVSIYWRTQTRSL
jgi:hypothetical protein